MASGPAFPPQSCLAFPGEVLCVLSCTWDWESPCQPQEGIQPWNDLLKRNQLMGNHAMTSSSGSSNVFPPQMQPIHSWIPLSSPAGGQLRPSPSTGSSDEAEKPSATSSQHNIKGEPKIV